VDDLYTHTQATGENMQGMNVDQTYIIEVQRRYISEGRNREALMEAAIEQLGDEQTKLVARIEELEDLAYPPVVVEGTEQE